VETPCPEKVGREPGQIEIPAVDRAAVHPAQREESAVPQDRPPRHRGMRRGRVDADEMKLRGVYRPMGMGIIAEPCEPRGGPQKSDSAEDRKSRAPGNPLDQEHGKWLRERTTQCARHDGETKRAAAFAGGEPAREGAAHARECPRLTHPKEKTQREQRGKASG